MKKSESEPSSFPPETSSSTSSITHRRLKFGQFLLQSSNQSPNHPHNLNVDDDDLSSSSTTSSSRRPSSDFPISDIMDGTTAAIYSPYINYHPTTTRRSSSPSSISRTYSPYTKSPWSFLSPLPQPRDHYNNNYSHYYELIGSLIREEGHVYSLATSSHFLYTGSDSKNIRIWSKSRLRESGGFKSGSGLVKSIIVTTRLRKIFTGHQDGKIRVWTSDKNTDHHQHRRVGSVPSWTDAMWMQIIRRHGRRVSEVRHFDAVSCLSVNEDAGLLYSGSWDKSVKVWRLKDYKCVESIKAHHDAVNAVVVGFDGLVFTGSADGTIKVWRRELHGTKTQHFYVQTLLDQPSAVTSLAVISTTTTNTTTTTTSEIVNSNNGVMTTNIVYGGTSDGLVNFWEWEERLTYGGVLRGHKQAVLCLCTAGTLVLSGSADSSICVWKREDGAGSVHTCLSVLTGHGGPVKCLAVEEEEEEVDINSSEDEEMIMRRCWRVYSGSLDKSVKVWRVREDGGRRSEAPDYIVDSEIY